MKKFPQIALKMEPYDSLICTEFQFKGDFEGMNLTPIRFVRGVSPFYPGEKWAVRRLSDCLGVNGWEYEPLPSSRDDEFYKRCRFDSLESAVAAANAAIEMAAEIEQKS